MTAPVWHRIELNTVRELHFVCLVELTELLLSLCLSLRMSSLSLLAVFYASVVGEFVLLEICDLSVVVVPRRRGTPSSWQLGRKAIVSLFRACGATAAGGRGGKNRRY